MNMRDVYNPLPNRRPVATAKLRGSDQVPGLNGDISFYAAPEGTIVSARVSGLPPISMPTEQNRPSGRQSRRRTHLSRRSGHP